MCVCVMLRMKVCEEVKSTDVACNQSVKPMRCGGKHTLNRDKKGRRP
jgi:hypothetical protein